MNIKFSSQFRDGIFKAFKLWDSNEAYNANRYGDMPEVPEEFQDGLRRSVELMLESLVPSVLKSSGAEIVTLSTSLHAKPEDVALCFLAIKFANDYVLANPDGRRINEAILKVMFPFNQELLQAIAATLFARNFATEKISTGKS
ncbi:MAG: hypothetical protein NT141_00330 [candidate division WWE3 bacterium]|nr:hypothetical protein [candidate division WWE3 bacterium]